LFPKVREEILKYFFRRACLHFIGNFAGFRPAPHLLVIIIAVVLVISAIAGPLKDATMSANNAGQSAIINYKLVYLSVNP